MRLKPGTSLLIPIAFLLFRSGAALGQAPTNSYWEGWPTVRANLELRPQTRLQLFSQLQNGEEFPYLQWNTGAMISYRLKRMLVPHLPDIDEDNEHYLVGGAGYEYLQTINKGKVSRENRIVIQATAALRPGAGLLLSDRNRVEFRRVNGDESVRYRNKLTVQRAFQVHHFRFTPYASGELFYASNHHSWNENQYAFGVQLPYKQRLMVDTYYLRQNCTTCSQNPLNVWGVTLNLFFLRPK
jgi:Protein of unknown function (DUF2490)